MAAEILLVNFPYTDGLSTKIRPALKLLETSISDSVHVYTIAMITSKMDQQKLLGDVIINNWEEANLLHPSLIRLNKIATIESNLVLRQLGSLSNIDIAPVKKTFKKIFNSWLSNS